MATETKLRAIETDTGITWAEWKEFFAPLKELDHAAMATKALEHIRTHGTSSSPEWWAQSATVAFEQEIARAKDTSAKGKDV